jgi:hypothetical protein
LKSLRRAAASAVGAARSADTTSAASPAPRASAWDRELIEMVLHQPEALPTLVEHVQLEDIDSPAARELFRLAVDLHHAGSPAGFEQLMSLTEDESAKSLLVDCDEHGSQKAASDFRQRLRDLLFRLEHRRQEPRHQSMLADFNQRRLDEAAELESLKTLYHDLSRRQAGPAPTDG